MTLALRRATLADRELLVALQEAAYAPNAILSGSRPIPLTWDYDIVLRDWEVWVVEGDEGFAGAAILQARPDDLYIESLAVAPALKRQGTGNRLLAFSLDRARALGRDTVRLIANARLTANVTWYERHGFATERIEERDGRRIVHMMRPLD